MGQNEKRAFIFSWECETADTRDNGSKQNVNDDPEQATWPVLGTAVSACQCGLFLPPDALKYMVDLSCPASAWLPQESLPPASTEVWGDLCRCLCHRRQCLRWSARSHKHPLGIKEDNQQICGPAISFTIPLLTLFNGVFSTPLCRQSAHSIAEKQFIPPWQWVIKFIA